MLVAGTWSQTGPLTRKDAAEAGGGGAGRPGSVVTEGGGLRVPQTCECRVPISPEIEQVPCSRNAHVSACTHFVIILLAKMSHVGAPRASMGVTSPSTQVP